MKKKKRNIARKNSSECTSERLRVIELFILGIQLIVVIYFSWKTYELTYRTGAEVDLKVLFGEAVGAIEKVNGTSYIVVLYCRGDNSGRMEGTIVNASFCLWGLPESTSQGPGIMHFMRNRQVINEVKIPPGEATYFEILIDLFVGAGQQFVKFSTTKLNGTLTYEYFDGLVLKRSSIILKNVEIKPRIISWRSVTKYRFDNGMLQVNVSNPIRLFTGLSHFSRELEHQKSSLVIDLPNKGTENETVNPFVYFLFNFGPTKVAITHVDAYLVSSLGDDKYEVVRVLNKSEVIILDSMVSVPIDLSLNLSELDLKDFRGNRSIHIRVRYWENGKEWINEYVVRIVYFPEWIIISSIYKVEIIKFN